MILAEFAHPQELLVAVRLLRERGYGLEAFTPYPIHEVQEAIGHRRSWIPLLVLVAGAVAAALGFAAQWWMNGFDYPLNVGGRPLDSLPAFVPIAFETAVLGAALAAVVGLLAFTGLPRPWHPLFEVEGFERASLDRFFLSVEGISPDEARALLPDAIRILEGRS